MSSMRRMRVVNSKTSNEDRNRFRAQDNNMIVVAFLRYDSETILGYCLLLKYATVLIAYRMHLKSSSKIVKE